MQEMDDYERIRFANPKNIDFTYCSQHIPIRFSNRMFHSFL